MFCSNCGKENAAGAGFCSNCGNKLETMPPPRTPEQFPGPQASQNLVRGKSPPVAAFLNLFFGIGYVYLGCRRVLGAPTIAFVVLAIVVYVILGYLTFGILSLVLAVLFAVDGWQKATGAKGFISAE